MATPEQQLNNIQQIQQALEDGFRSLTNSIQNVAEEIGEATDNLITFNTISKDITRTIRSISKANETLIDNQIRLNKGQLSSKKINEQIEQIETKRRLIQNRLLSLQNELNDALASGRITATEAAAKQAEISNLTAEVARSAKEVDDHYKNQLDKAERTEKAMGNLGNIVKGLNKIPIVGQFMQTEKIMSAMQETASKTESKTQVMLSGFKAIGSSIKEGILDPLTIITFLLTKALEANRQTVELGKQLGSSSENYRENLVNIVRSSNNINVTTANLVGAFNELVTATGFAYEFTADQLETQILLTKQVGLQADEAANVQKFAVLTGKTSEETYKSFVRGLTATRNQLRVGINFKATLAEALKVSGQLAANLGNNPERIAKAIVTAKAFGMTLEQVAKTGESLLNFESSIENELKAELLTGRQLNLERARAAALSGDQATLAEEIAKNVGTAADFAKMNVLQQKALAESVGMTADELANTLKNREQAIASGKSLAQVTEEEAQKALERQTIQDKFNQSILKLQDLIGNLIAGPLGGFLDMLSGALDIVNKLGNALSFLEAPLKVIAGLWATIKGIQLASLATTKAITIYEGMKRAYVGAQVSMATGYNAALLIRKSLLAGELAKTIAIAAAWAVANPIAALAGLGVAAAVSAGLYALTADDMVSEGGYGKRTLFAPEGAIRLNDNDTVIAGTNLGLGEGGGSMPSIDLTPMIAAINEVKAAVNNLANRPVIINMDSKQVGSSLVQGSYKMA